MERRLVKKDSVSRLICRDLAALIKEGRFPQGLLPSEESIAAMYGASRVSVRDALAQLQNMGYITRGQGKATVINSLVAGLECRISEGRPFQELLLSRGYQVRAESSAVERVACQSELGRRLDHHGPELYRMEKLFYADERPAIYVQNYYSPDRVDPRILDYTKEELSERSIFAILYEDLGFPEIAHDLIEVRPLCAGRELGARLDIPAGAALLMFSSLGVDSRQQPLMLNLEYYHPELLKFEEVRHSSYY